MNSWTNQFPEEADALRDLAAYVVKIPDEQWNFGAINANDVVAPCGTIGCALGHAPFVPSCAALGIQYDRTGSVPVLRGPLWSDAHEVFKLPESVACAIFYGHVGYVDDEEQPLRWSDVRQHHVAKRINHWLDTGELR